MGFRDRFRRHPVNTEPEMVSDRENLRRGVVRTGNLDWQGLPIDRHAGAPIDQPEAPRRFRDKVADFLDRMGGKIERPNPHIPVLSLNQFNRDAETTERAYWRQFNNDRRLENNTDSLQ